MAGPPAPSVPPFRRRDADRVLVSHAQVGEDIRLARVLWDRPPGFYVDVGAGDPVANSVTKLFYDAGWHGINIEPGPAFGRLEFARPDDLNLRMVVGATEGERDFWVCEPNTELSSLVPPDRTILPAGSRLRRERIECRRLDSILEDHGEATIDFLKVDVEGAESDVLASIDLRRFRPLVILVEAIEPLTHRPSHAGWEPELLKAGYVSAAFDGVNRFYVVDEHVELCEVLGYPLSPLDNYARGTAAPGRADEAHSESHAHPTLAEELATEPAVEYRPLPMTVVLDGVDDGGHVSRLVANGSSFFVLGPNGLSTEDPDWPARYPATLEGFREAIGRTPNDVLIVSDPTLLTRPIVEELCSTLATDSACATASADDRVSDALSGVLPRAVDAPARGVVLVRRDHLVLALDEARLLEGNDVGFVRIPHGDGVVQEVLACLVRPGFVHRTCRRRESVGVPAAPAVGVRRERRPAAEVLVDARCLSHPMSGTQVHVLGLLGGLLRAGAQMSVLVPQDVHPTCASSLVDLRKAVRLIERVGPGRPAIFHRPFQVGSLTLLADCLSVGERLVLTHLDMIFDRTPSYVGSTTSWERYHATTLAALASADELGFLSRHTANDAASDGVLELDRGAVVHLGVDHLDGSDAVELSSPPLGGRPYLLVVGNAYRHKNRLFALRLFKWLVERHAWDGGLVLSGQHPDIGSSREAEDAFLRRESGLAGRVVDLGHVSAAERNGLYRGAELVLFPSLYEGFGFIPFEAAAFGRACAYSFRASMRELLPQEGALPSFDLDEAGPFVLDLLESATARERVVAGVRAAATRLTWDRTAAGYLELYARAVERPPRGISRELLSSASIGGAGRMTEREARVLDIYRRRRGFRLAVDATIQTTAAALRVARRDGEP